MLEGFDFKVGAYIIMVVVGMTQLRMSLHARILFVGEFVNAPWLMEYSLKEMVIPTVKQMGQDVARSITEDVGMKPEMGISTLLARIAGMVNVHVLRGLKVMVSKVVKILMNAKIRKHASARNAVARIPGEAMTAPVVVTFCI